MSIWGKILGGATGFAFGGPIGAIIGAVAGHAVDKYRATQQQQGDGDPTKSIAFTIGVIILSAKMAKADGVVTREEVSAFKEVFHIPANEMSSVGKLFDEARKDASGFEPYAEQVARMFAHEPAVLEELIGGLFHIARADGTIHPAELDFLAKVAIIFGFSDRDFERLRASYDKPETSSPYAILGVPRDADDVEIKKAYRKLLLVNHPDKLIAQGLPQEFIDLANEKMAAINAAYDAIKKQRGM